MARLLVFCAIFCISAVKAPGDDFARLHAVAVLVEGAPAIEVTGEFELPDGTEVVLSLELDACPAPGGWRSARVVAGRIAIVYEFRDRIVLPGLYTVRARTAAGIEEVARVRVGTPEEEVGSRAAFDRWLGGLEAEAAELGAPGSADRPARVAALRAEVLASLEPGRYVALYRDDRVRDLLVRSTLLGAPEGARSALGMPHRR